MELNTNKKTNYRWIVCGFLWVAVAVNYVDSKGMLNTLKSNDSFIIESLRIFLEDPRESSKTLFFILDKKDVEKARKVIDETLGGINNPNTGIMFGIDLTFVDGLNSK